MVMNLQNLSDSELLSKTRSAATHEKSATLDLLDHLLEVERRGIVLRGVTVHFGITSIGRLVTANRPQASASLPCDS